jgi:ligand-binding sensor domain-containing protein
MLLNQFGDFMLKNILSVILTSILLTSINTAQIGSWQNFTSMKSVSAFNITQNNIWAATEGGVFMFNRSDSSFTQLTKTEGISSQQLLSITTSSQDEIWVGSTEGYINIIGNDRTITKIFDIVNSNEVLKGINYLSTSGDTVFASIDFGLSLLSSKTHEFIETIIKFGNFNPKARVLFATKINGKIYVSTSEGLAVEKDNASSLTSPDSWNSYSFSSLSADYPTKSAMLNDSLFIASDNGLYLLKNNSVQYFAFRNSEIKDIAVYNNELYVLLKNKLYKKSGSDFQVIYNYQSNFHQLGFFDNEIFIASSDGLIAVKNGSEKLICPNGPTTNFFLSLDVDRTGNLWVGSGADVYGRGVFELTNNDWTIYDKSNTPEFISNAYHRVYAGGSGTNYFLNWGQGYTSYDGKSFKNFTTQNTGMVGINGAPNFLVISNVREDNRGNVWVLNYWSDAHKPLSVMTSDSVWHHFEIPFFQLQQKELFDQMVIDQYNTKWFADILGHQGLLYFNDRGTIENTNDDTWGMLTTADGLSGTIIQALAVDKNGELWIGTNSGLNIIPNPDFPTAISEVYAMKTVNITSIYVDPLNNKWVGTDKGVYYLTGDGFNVIQQYTKETSPLSNDYINSIAFNNSTGTVFFGTDYGLSALTTEAIAPRKAFSELFVYPNPYKVNDDVQLTIDGLIERASIKIFDLNGKLINGSDFGGVTSPGGRIATWNGTDLSGNKVGTGVYLIAAYNSEGKEVASTKVAVIK